MWNWNNQINLNTKNIMRVFWNQVAGKEKVITGNVEYIRPLNYITDKKEIIVNENIPILNLRGKKLAEFETALTQYIQTFFSSELFWANPLTTCNTQDDKLLHALSTIWLNATPDDYDNPIQYLNRYTNFLKDKTFEEFWEGQQLNKIQTLQNCSIEIKKSEQEEFQETPTSIKFKVKKEGIEKELPRIAYGISEGTAYIYGIQSPQKNKETEEEKIIKKINRSRFKINKMDNIPEDYKNIYLKQEPYAYISLFIFLSMLKQKNINKIVMPAYLPERYESKEKLIIERIEKESFNIKNGKEAKMWIKDLNHEISDHQRIQYNITNKFLSYMTRMESDISGIEIKETPEENNGNLKVDISKMQITEQDNIIFYELYKKVQNLMKTKEKEER